MSCAHPLLRSLRPTTSLTPIQQCLRPSQPRFISTTAALSSGHSRWSKIKHDKGKVDKLRANHFTRLCQEISVASKHSNGDMTDPRLLATIGIAKKAAMPKERIQSAVNRGLGISSTGAALEPLTVEAIFSGVAILIEVMTESRLRALADIRHILTKVGAQVSPTAYLFNKYGIVEVSGSGVDADSVLEQALELEGVEDVEDADEGRVMVLTEPSAVSVVADGLKKAMESAEGKEVVLKGIEFVPKEDTMVDAPPGKKEEELGDLVSALQEYRDVVQVYTNLRD